MGDLISFPHHGLDPRTGTERSAASPPEDPAVRVEPHPNQRYRGHAHPVEPLWREAAGAVMRRTRHRRHQTLAAVAARAGISVPYLSEIERGRKEPSSEVLAAVAGALGLTLADVAGSVVRSLVSIRTDAETIRQPPTGPGGPVAFAA